MAAGWGRRVVASAAVVLVLALAACGGSKADTSSKKTTTTTRSTSTSTSRSTSTSTTRAGGAAPDPRTAAQLAADKALATAANLKATDLPAGWTASGSSSSGSSGSSGSSDPFGNDQMARCLGVDPSLFTDTKVDESSPDFDKGDAEVSSEIEVRPTAEIAKGEFDIVRNPKLPACFSQYADKAAQSSNDTPGLTFGHATTSNLSFPAIGDQTFGLRFLLPATYQGETINSYIDLVVIRVGRSFLTMSYSNVNAPFDTALAEQTARTVAARARS